jgi:acyl-CoA reductase-like NAD-dependent aldehyde dehydrogenase
MLHLPILRAGRPYRSLVQAELKHVRSGEPVARVSQANRGLIARDMLAAPRNRLSMQAVSVREMLAICRRAAELFVSAELELDPLEGVRQTPEDYVRALADTTGMPLALGRANMEKIRFVLAEMETVLGGLTRGLDLDVLDSGWAVQDGRAVSYIGEADTLGVVLPSNSPGVHSLWLPALPLRTPLTLKPGSREPWTPLRVCQALLAAGCPGEALGYYPTDSSGATEVLLRSDRSMIFGDASTVAAWRDDTRVQIHGPGWSKVFLGADAAERWTDALEVMAESVAANGGRSCLNASGIWTPARGREIAEGLARRLAEIEILPLDHPDASVSAFADPALARRVSEIIDRQLEQPGAEDVTATLSGGERVVELDGCTFLRPTVIWCSDPSHSLARAEYLFPFVSVVELPQDEMPEAAGETLVGTLISEDERFRARLMNARNVDRLNLGAIPTSHISWDQPHEGNLFEHLYRQRALQATG